MDLILTLQHKTVLISQFSALFVFQNINSDTIFCLDISRHVYYFEIIFRLYNNKNGMVYLQHAINSIKFTFSLQYHTIRGYSSIPSIYMYDKKYAIVHVPYVRNI
ncbi:hypothetical protein RVBP17_3450 [Pseudomonas phage sp. 30-3]|nr:hypothetical protein RVBP17_3450 [Pseudomonas phage sp. 30-3]